MSLWELGFLKFYYIVKIDDYLINYFQVYYEANGYRMNKSGSFVNRTHLRTNSFRFSN